MPTPQNTRTLRFVLLTFFGDLWQSLIILYKIYSSSDDTRHSNLDTSRIAVEQIQYTNDRPNLSSNEDSSAAGKDIATIPTNSLLGGRANATFVTLARNSDIWEIAKSIRHVEDRFNRKFNYDWVFLNDKPFDEQFRKVTSNLVSGKAKYGLIPPEHWSFPDHIDQKKAQKVREDMAAKGVIYGDSVSYRHMCRFESGFFFQHELMKEYEYYWRVEPSIELYCDIDYDVFKFMKVNNKKYGFTLSLYEYIETIPTLWASTKNFIKEHPEHIAQDNAMKFLSDNDGADYNRCHFWSNFEVGNLDFWRGQAYTDFFNKLDQDGGFFYERWGDAPVHSIGASLLLSKDELHFFDDIGYYHVPFTHCPTSEDDRLKFKCSCEPKKNFDWKGYSCTSRYFEMMGKKRPIGYEKQMD